MRLSEALAKVKVVMVGIIAIFTLTLIGVLTVVFDIIAFNQLIVGLGIIIMVWMIVLFFIIRSAIKDLNRSSDADALNRYILGGHT